MTKYNQAILGRGWGALLGHVGPFYLWAIVWLAALFVPFARWPWILAIAVLGGLSALFLAPTRHHGRHLVMLSVFFLMFWALFMGCIYLFNPDFSLRPVLNLAAWLALGLNLMLAKTPLEMALSLGKVLTPFLGRLKAQKLALSLALLARLIPSFLAMAIDLKKTADRRAQRLSLSLRLSLWGRAMLRVTLSQTDDLAKTLLKRWPW